MRGVERLRAWHDGFSLHAGPSRLERWARGDAALHTPLTDLVTGGEMIGVAARWSVLGHFAFEPWLEYGILGVGANVSNLVALAGETPTSLAITNARSFAAGGRIAYASNRCGFAPYGELGLGFRWIDLHGTGTSVLSGPEVELGLGVSWHRGHVVVRPDVTFAVGEMSNVYIGIPERSGGGPFQIFDRDTYEIMTIGVAGMFELDGWAR